MKTGESLKEQAQAELDRSDLWGYVSDPKKRTVIYGLTNRLDDPWFLRINDYFIDELTPVSPKQKSRFFHSLKLLVLSGVQFIRAMRMLSERTDNVHFARILNTITYDMEHNGMSFSESIQKYPKVFDQSEVKMIYSGELTGKIEESLESLAVQLQKNIELKMRVRGALMYPITVIVALLLASVAVMVFIVPKLMGLFETLGGNLPLSTQILITLSNFMVNFWWLVIALLALGVTLFINWKQSDDGRLKWDGMVLEFPVISSLVQNIQTVRISQNFAALMASGIPVNKALIVLSEVIPNRVIGQAISAIELKVRKGATLHESFAAQPELDSVLSEIIEVGEKSGHISEVLNKLGDQYEQEVDAQLKNLSTILEPLIMAVVACGVIFLLFAVMTPIFQMNELFSESATG